MGNILGIGKKYLRHFVNNNGVRWVLLQGGRRSGKSFAIHKWLHFLASAKRQTVGIVAASFPALQLCIGDFQRATGLTVVGNAVYGHCCQLSNGSVFVFRAFDDPTKVQGTTFDTLYVEEALNVPQQVVSVLSMSVTGSIYAAYNPTKKSYLDEYVLPDKSNLLVTTFKDNPFLTEPQREEFENIRVRAMKPTASLLDKYNYKVYYLGEFGELSGKVFPIIYTCTDEEYDRVSSKELKGLDFGIVESRDQTALCGGKVHNNCLYLREYIYDNMECQKDINLARRMRDLGITEYEPICCDYAGIGKQRIRNLVTACDGEWTEEGISHGFYCYNAEKGKILDGLQRMTNFDKIIVTEKSVNLREELANYELKDDGKPVEKYANHLVDAARYLVNSYDFV